MNFNKSTVLSLLFLSLIFSSVSINSSFAGRGFTLPIQETDTNNYQLYSFYDIRDRESFVQVTSPDSASVLHVQVFDVANLCNENNFFDTYTPNDTHVYNLRDLTTNNGNSAGFVLPDGAYGFVVITAVLGQGLSADTGGNIIGNFRVIDNAGYEYRTNSQGPSPIDAIDGRESYTFNFNTTGNVNASDVIGITVNNITSGEVNASGISLTFDTTLFNENEVEFSCSDTTFACTADTFEYGINDAIPNSRDGSVVCGSNVISEGLVKLELNSLFRGIGAFAGYVGLNNGNGRGSMDSMHQDRGALSCEDRGVCRVFASSTGQNGNLGGVSGADAICQGLADASPLTQGGRYLAWNSDSLGNSPSTRFTQSTVQYQLVDRTVIADNYTDLTDGTINNFINVNESNGASGSLGAWTGTEADGTPASSNCNNWTDGTVLSSGILGFTGASSSSWSNDSELDCTNTDSLYCFEQ